jgi:hypothetical protein
MIPHGYKPVIYLATNGLSHAVYSVEQEAHNWVDKQSDPKSFIIEELELDSDLL